MHLTNESNQKPCDRFWWMLSEFNIYSDENNVKIGLESPFLNKVKVHARLGSWLCT